MANLTGYELSRNWFDFSFENPELISPNHSAIYFFAIEHCNRLGWRTKFGFPTQMAMDAIGIKKHETYIRYFNDLVLWGFILLVQKSVNQYSSNIISLNNATPKNGKALDKAILTHAGKQTDPIGESNSSIDKHITIKPITESKQDFTHSDLSKSNLFRNPTIPTIEEVNHAFLSSGGTLEMAKIFFDKNSAVGWYLRNSPITNFKNLLPSFISNFKQNQNGKSNTKYSGIATIKRVIERGQQKFEDEQLRRSTGL